MRHVIITGFSIRKELLQRIEIERGDVSRSRFLSKLVEQALESDSLKNYRNDPIRLEPTLPLAIAESKPLRSDSEHE
jgi:metal-responsive CopG/Arc/MetJ family transcriptional regulator